MTGMMTAWPCIPVLLLFTRCITATTTTSSSSSSASSSSPCSFSDILSNNTSCLPAIGVVSLVSLPRFELQLQVSDATNNNNNNNNANGQTIDDTASLDGIRFALEYYLNYSLARFDDDDAGFDDGGFGYAQVDSAAPASSSQPIRMLRGQTTTRSLSTSWRLSVSAGAFYNLSPGGWIFSSVPSSTELMQRVQSVMEEPLDDDDNAVVGGKFAAVLEMLSFQREEWQPFRDVVGVNVVPKEDYVRPSLTPTSIPLGSTMEPTLVDWTNESTATGIVNSPSPSMVPEMLVTPRPTKLQTQSSEPSPLPTVAAVKTLTPTPVNNDAVFLDKVSSSSPTVANGDGEGLFTNTMIPSNQYNTYTNHSDASFDLDPGTNINNDQDAIEIQNNGHPTDGNNNNNNNTNINSSNSSNNININNGPNQENFNKELLSSTSANKNNSKIIASVSVLLVLVVVSGAFFISRRNSTHDKHGPLQFLQHDCSKGDGQTEEKTLKRDLDGNRAVFVSGRKENAKHPSCKEDNLDKNADATPVPPRKSRNRVGTVSWDSASSPNDSSRDYRHRSVKSSDRYNLANLSSEYTDSTRSNPNDGSLLSTPSPNRYDPCYIIANYNEEKIAKKEMARELFLTKEEMRNVGKSSGSMIDFCFAERPLRQISSDVTSEDTASLGVCYQTDNKHANIQSSPSLEYSASDSMSNDTSYHQSRRKLLHTSFNVISPSSLPSRRKPLEPPNHGPDPPENTGWRDPPGLDPKDITVVTNDDSLHSINDNNDPSCFFSSYNVVSPNEGIRNGWNNCLADCAPDSLKDLVSPISPDKDDYDEENDIIAGGEKWFHHAMCGKERGDDNSRRVSPSFSNGHSEYENDWDFGDVEDEGDVKSGEDAFSLRSVLS